MLLAPVIEDATLAFHWPLDNHWGGSAHMSNPWKIWTWHLGASDSLKKPTL